MQLSLTSSDLPIYSLIRTLWMGDRGICRATGIKAMDIGMVNAESSVAVRRGRQDIRARHLHRPANLILSLQTTGDDVYTVCMQPSMPRLQLVRSVFAATPSLDICIQAGRYNRQQE
jgi:hypothetical protein